MWPKIIGLLNEVLLKLTKRLYKNKTFGRLCKSMKEGEKKMATPPPPTYYSIFLNIFYFFIF